MAEGTVRAFADPASWTAPVEIDPGLFGLRLPLPFALNHVNIWLADDGDGWTIIDTGFADDRCRAVWSGLLEGFLAGKPVNRVLVTHFHPDHVGLAGEVCARTGAGLLMSRTDWLTARMLALDDTEEYIAAGDAHWRRARMPEEAAARQRARGNAYRRGVTVPPASFTRLRAGDTLMLAGSAWRVIVGEGHAPEQVTLYSPERGVLIAADQILPRISPVISVWATQPEADPLGDFLRTLEDYRSLPEATRVLPSHHHPFTGLHVRLDQLIAHHRQRLGRTLDACAEAVTTADVVERLFPQALDQHQEGFALAETLAHLNRLWCEGHIERSVDRDSTVRWRRAQPKSRLNPSF